MTPTAPAQLQDRVLELVQQSQTYRTGRLSLGCAESLTSGAVRGILGSDLGRRYGTKGGYAGGAFLDEIEAIGEWVACELFGCRHAILSPITGHVALESVLAGLTDPGDTIITLAPKDGGYPIGIAERFGLKVVHFAFDPDQMNLDVGASEQLIQETLPRLVVFGSARYLFPHPVAELQQACRDAHAVIAYDASHPFGLIAGGEFHDPIRMGVDVLFGSTSKTLFGPTRGLILVREDEDLKNRITDVFNRFVLQSTYQLNSLAALVVSLTETLAFGREFAADVVRNAQRLAARLEARGVEIVGRSNGYTKSQLVLPVLSRADPEDRLLVRERLERAGILGDRHLRFGTQQVTRLGMGIAEMDLVGDCIADAIQARDADRIRIAEIRRQIDEIANAHRSLVYSFEAGADAYEYWQSAPVRVSPAQTGDAERD